MTHRDGILTFLWYVERYLHLARASYPKAWDRLSGDPCWRGLILSVWGKAWDALYGTDATPGLGIEDDAIEALVLDQDLLSEVERLRDAEGCP